MAEKLIYLEGVDPVDFYGVNNVRFNKFIELFPDLKIVPRGNEIRVSGDKKRLEDFEDKVDLFLRYLRKFQTVTLHTMEELLNGSAQAQMEAPGPDEEVILHGEGGRKIRAITVNQKKLVEDGKRNDLLIAVGPAGTSAPRATSARCSTTAWPGATSCRPCAIAIGPSFPTTLAAG